MDRSNPWIARAGLALLAGIFSIVAVNFVGDLTIYAQRNVAVREGYHRNILNNEMPPKGWSGEGMNSTNIRIAVPYLVEFAHRQTGLDVGKLYKAVDLVCIWLTLMLFFSYLRHWFTAEESALACAYFIGVLPLTFAYHSYQPWDRASLAAWLAALWLARSERFVPFCAVAMAGMLIKYDEIVLPMVYFLGHATRTRWRTLLLQTAAIGLALLAIFYGLRTLLPGGFEPRHIDAQAIRNLMMLLHQGPFYAPVLAFGLPAVLAVFGFRASDQFARASLAVAALAAAILFVSTNFEEVRAEQMFFPLLAPAALSGLRRLGGRAAKTS